MAFDFASYDPDASATEPVTQSSGKGFDFASYDPDAQDEAAFSTPEEYAADVQSKKKPQEIPELASSGLLAGTDTGFVDLLKTSAQALTTHDPNELATIISKRHPDINVTYNKREDGEVYPVLYNQKTGAVADVNKPGISEMDIYQLLGLGSLYTTTAAIPGGLPAVMAASGGIGATLEGTQAASGGKFDLWAPVIDTALPFGMQKVVAPVAKAAISKMRGMLPTSAGMQAKSVAQGKKEAGRDALTDFATRESLPLTTSQAFKGKGASGAVAGGLSKVSQLAENILMLGRSKQTNIARESIPGKLLERSPDTSLPSYSSWSHQTERNPALMGEVSVIDDVLNATNPNAVKELFKNYRMLARTATDPGEKALFRDMQGLAKHKVIKKAISDASGSMNKFKTELDKIPSGAFTGNDKKFIEGVKAYLSATSKAEGASSTGNFGAITGLVSAINLPAGTIGSALGLKVAESKLVRDAMIKLSKQRYGTKAYDNTVKGIKALLRKAKAAKEPLQSVPHTQSQEYGMGGLQQNIPVQTNQ